MRSLSLETDRRAAPAARAPGAAVSVVTAPFTPFASKADVRDDAASRFRDVGLQILARRPQQRAQRLVGDGACRREWIHAAQKQRLAFIDVADAGDEALVEEDVGDLLIAARPHAADGFVLVERLA